jgi:hypothetical protein
MKGRRRFRRLLPALLGSATLGMIAAPPASAAIGTMTAHLSLSRNGQFLENVNVSGLIAMPQAEAQGYINSRYRVVWRLWGDDPISDDFLFGPNDAQLTATPQGLQFGELGLQINRHRFLNEDTSVFDNRDEIYAGVRFLNASGATVKSKETNRVVGYF